MSKRGCKHKLGSTNVVDMRKNTKKYLAIAFLFAAVVTVTIGVQQLDGTSPAKASASMVCWDEPNAEMPEGYEHLCGDPSLAPETAYNFTELAPARTVEREYQLDALIGDDNGDGTITPDESGWDDRTMAPPSDTFYDEAGNPVDRPMDYDLPSDAVSGCLRGLEDRTSTANEHMTEAWKQAYGVTK